MDKLSCTEWDTLHRIASNTVIKIRGWGYNPTPANSYQLE